MSDQQQDKIVHKIEKIEKIDVSKQVEAAQVESPEEMVATRAKFDSAVQRADSNWVERSAQTRPVEAVNTELKSPLAELGMNQAKIQRLEPVSAEKLVAAAEALQDDMRVKRERLQSIADKWPSETKLGPGFDAPLQKLQHIDSSLRSALGIVGSEVSGAQVPPAASDATGQGPLVKFLNYLTHGDRQLKGVVGEISKLEELGPEKLSPAKLMAVQIKLTYVQQELEFFTNVLNKALESTKTIMNVQI